jgi:MFS transporter, DHA2 family, multidrug resistance protein
MWRFEQQIGQQRSRIEGRRVEGNVTSIASQAQSYRGNHRVLFGIILGVITFWLFAQTTLNIAPDMGRHLGVGASTMNAAIAITALFSGIFIVIR